ncbi:DUF935 family protein [Micromonospora sp. NPDC053740]|uniref:phage portal protein family protein n=1 Tax=Micromonospora sp. NPDC053740 TaxID=3155173 RepID=UPI00341D0482
MALPTRLHGSVSDGTYDAWLGEALEQVPALVYPLSVETYAQMRRDPQLAAILAGYTLQIRRASWSVNPAGCRPEVAQLVADDLGLPVTGDDTPRAARVRGVSWAEHLRAALACLTYGHSGFEILAEMRAGLARLSMLAERPAHTITAIYADQRSGAFQGVTQDIPGRLDVPQIKADRMVWYCHEREGNSWQGTSLLRPAYGPWLLKRELQRVLATSSRRFGMGVPTVKALPGTSPTDGQMTAALGLATSARVGDQGGAAVPPGFTFELVGMTGSTPDTLAFIRYLDQQMSRMSLMSHLDLGTSESGSRALAESFVDVLMMSIQSVAETVADTITRQAAARLVGWNFGDDEPVPAVTVSGIGDRREITAQSLDLLLRSGALSADPALEAHIRREWRLPERQATPEPVPRPVAAGARRPRAVAAAAPVEPANYQDLADQHAQAVTDLSAVWEQESPPLVDALTEATAAEVSAGMLVGFGSLAVPPVVTAGLTAALIATLSAGAALAAAGAAAELAALGIVASTALGDDHTTRIEQIAEATVGLIVAGYASGAGRVAMAQTGPDTPASTVGQAVRDHLIDLSTAKGSGLVAGNLAAAVTSAQAEARRAVLEQAPAGTRFVANEVLDDGNRCGPCGDVTGTEYDSLTAALVDYPTGLRFKDCAGGHRCRGLIAPLLPIVAG